MFLTKTIVLLKKSLFLGWTNPLSFTDTPFLLIVPSGLIVSRGIRQSYLPSRVCFINLRAFWDALITGFWEFSLGFWGQDLYAINCIWILIFHVWLWVPLLCALWMKPREILALVLNWILSYNTTCWNAYRNVFDF